MCQCHTESVLEQAFLFRTGIKTLLYKHRQMLFGPEKKCLNYQLFWKNELGNSRVSDMELHVSHLHRKCQYNKIIET